MTVAWRFGHGKLTYYSLSLSVLAWSQKSLFIYAYITIPIYPRFSSSRILGAV
jgi:hypothetical protein